MDRKNKVWLIVLIVLLILAMAGMIVSRNQLADSQTLLAQAQNDAAAREGFVCLLPACH